MNIWNHLPGTPLATQTAKTTVIQGADRDRRSWNNIAACSGVISGVTAGILAMVGFIFKGISMMDNAPTYTIVRRGRTLTRSKNTPGVLVLTLGIMIGAPIIGGLIGLIPYLILNGDKQHARQTAAANQLDDNRELQKQLTRRQWRQLSSANKRWLVEKMSPRQLHHLRQRQVIESREYQKLANQVRPREQAILRAVTQATDETLKDVFDGQVKRNIQDNPQIFGLILETIEPTRLNRPQVQQALIPIFETIEGLNWEEYLASNRFDDLSANPAEENRIKWKQGEEVLYLNAEKLKGIEGFGFVEETDLDCTEVTIPAGENPAMMKELLLLIHNPGYAPKWKSQTDVEQFLCLADKYQIDLKQHPHIDPALTAMNLQSNETLLTLLSKCGYHEHLNELFGAITRKNYTLAHKLFKNGPRRAELDEFKNTTKRAIRSGNRLKAEWEIATGREWGWLKQICKEVYREYPRYGDAWPVGTFPSELVPR